VIPWIVLTHNWDRTSILSLTNGTTTLAIPSRVSFTHRGETVEGSVSRIVLMLDGYSVHVRTERGTFCLEPEELTLVAPVPVRSEPTAQDIWENRARFAREQALADLKRLRDAEASYSEILATERRERELSYAE
jgi:hypothetical protein